MQEFFIALTIILLIFLYKIRNFFRSPADSQFTKATVLLICTDEDCDEVYVSDEPVSSKDILPCGHRIQYLFILGEGFKRHVRDEQKENVHPADTPAVVVGV
jgi:hypothetical protein